jgi:hypothetical protein
VTKGKRWTPPATGLHTETYMGPICPFAAHSIGSRDGLIPRYKDSEACVRCVAALMEGRVSLDVHRIHREWQRRFLEFWTFVDIGDPDQCWAWHGRYHPRGRGGNLRSYHTMRRHWHVQKGGYPNTAAPRVAGWFTWGDYGRLPVETSCGNINCCNPLHIRVRHVPHFYMNRKLDVINLRFDARKLQDETASFAEVTRQRQPLRFKRMERVNSKWLEYRLSEADVGPGDRFNPETLVTPIASLMEAEPTFDPDLD